MVVGKGRTALGEDGVPKPEKQHSEAKTLKTRREAQDPTTNEGRERSSEGNDGRS